MKHRRRHSNGSNNNRAGQPKDGGQDGLPLDIDEEAEEAAQNAGPPVMVALQSESFDADGVPIISDEGNGEGRNGNVGGNAAVNNAGQPHGGRHQNNGQGGHQRGQQQPQQPPQ